MRPKSVSKKRTNGNPRLVVLRKRVATAPTDPGVYRWLNEEGTVLYVGKAKNLRNRLRSYVTKEKAVGPWKQSFLEQIADFEVTVTNTELEALIFETNQIKELRPKYNVLMKDGKNYIYARVTVQDPFPRIEAVRKIAEDTSSPSGLRSAGGAKYFGPMASGGELWAMLAMLRSVFPFRTCSMEIEPATSIPQPLPPREEGGIVRKNKHIHTPPPVEEGIGVEVGHTQKKGGGLPIDVVCKHKDRATPCLDFHIQKCSAPCVGNRTPALYWSESIEGALRFLKGDYDSVRPVLQERMKQAVAERKFELAAQLRDNLQALDRLEGRQLITDTSGEDSDIIAVAVLSGRADVVIMQRRGGRLIGDQSFSLAGQAESAEEVLGQFIAQYYDEGTEIPDEILVSEELKEKGVFEELFSKKKGRKVKIILPARGRKSHLLQLAEKNVREKAKQRELKWEAEKRNTESALGELTKTLKLSSPPARIEGYDISHLGGTETVGSMVVLKNGKASNDQYRSFTIRSLKPGEVDDYKALREVLRRRLRHLTGGLQQELKDWKKRGVVIRRALKADRAGIKALLEGHPQMGIDDLEKGVFFVALREKDIVGCCRLYEHLTGLLELRSVCIAPGEQGQRLGQCLITSMLSREKKRKIYAIMNPNLEQYYAEIGFRHILKVPPILEKDLEKLQREHSEWDLSMVVMFDPLQHKPDASLEAAPNLLVIDGGKGQLSVAVEVLQSLKVDIPVIGLAKQEEDIFVPGESDPVFLAKESPAQFLLQRLRDEAHRFANRHREGRGMKAAKESVLDTIPSIGPETRKKLLVRFGSLSGIRAASDGELSEVLSESQVREVRRHL